MSPEKKRDFETEWPLLARRLGTFLARKKVPAAKREDLIQETAFRLYRTWDTVDRSRPAWALTVTIVLNLLRDEYRKAPHADVVAELPDIPHPDDVERSGLARIEIGRVRQALSEMSPAHRLILLAEVGHPTGVIEPGRDKMRRMRARRKLTEILERVSAIFVIPARRLSDLVHAVVGARDGVMTGASCILCTVLGFGVAVTAPLAPPAAEASTVREAIADRGTEVTARIALSPEDELASVHPGVDSPDPSTVKPRVRKVKPAGSSADDGSLLGLPLPSDPSPEPPTIPLPGNGPNGGPSLPPPPPAPLPGNDPSGIVQQVDRALSTLTP